MKSTSTVLSFVILLTASVHNTVSKPPYDPSDFEEFVKRLEKVINDSPPDILPFTVSKQLSDKLKQTSIRFKKLCICYDAESQRKEGDFSPMASLEKTIKKIFYSYSKSAKESGNKVLEIQFVDPVGFNAYLTQKNEDHESPTFMESIEEFRRITFTKFDRFLQRFEEFINDSTPNDLPFLLKICVIENLKETSNTFKELCIRYDGVLQMRNGKFSPVTSLIWTINQIFDVYEDSAKTDRDILRKIKEMDPIGLNVYLTKKNVSNSSPTFMQTVKEFKATMDYRVRLFKSRTDDSQIQFFKENPHKKVYKIPDDVRERVTNEYIRFQDHVIDFFNEIAMEQLPRIKMYRLVDYKNIENYQPHRSHKIDDVQILYSLSMRKNHGSHAVCIYYQASNQNVLVYDSRTYESLDPNQQQIVNRLYPFKKDIIFMKPKTLQGAAICGVFAMIYATMLLLKVDPAKTEIRLNNVHGDETLYMRLHILNMFANRRLALMN